MIAKKRKLLFIHKNYKNYLRTIIKNHSYQDTNLPIEVEDVYYEFLQSLLHDEKILSMDFDGAFRSYLGTRCRWFTKNLMRKYSSFKHRVMNHSYPFPSDNWGFMDSEPSEEIQIDLSDLSSMEMSVYKIMFLDNKGYKEASKNLNLSYFKIRKCVNSIKFKLIAKLRN